jgi:phosphatidylglycerol:prolipoprotein diacylglycerol transferase
VHRVLFRIPMPFGLKPLQVAAYGAMVALGALVGIYIASVRAKRSGVNPNLILDLALVLIISGMIGARLFFFVFDDWSEFTNGGVGHALKLFINFPSGGLSFYGALALGIPAGIVFLRLRMRHIWGVGDIAMPSIALGIAFARIGCYLNGCCFGKPCPEWFPLAQHFPLRQGDELSIPAQHYLSLPGGQWPVAIYPTQLISSLNAFVLFIVLSVLFRRRRFDGQLFCVFGIWYGISRFLIEFLRADNARTVFGVLTTWQLAGLLLAAGCAVLWVVFQRRGRLTVLPTT